MIDAKTESDLLNALTVICGRRQVIQVELEKPRPSQVQIAVSWAAIATAEKRIEQIVRGLGEVER